MKMYSTSRSNNGSMRKPMMYGGGAGSMMSKNTMGDSMAMGMKKDKMNKNMAAMGMGMMYGSKVKKK